MDNKSLDCQHFFRQRECEIKCATLKERMKKRMGTALMARRNKLDTRGEVIAKAIIEKIPAANKGRDAGCH